MFSCEIYPPKTADAIQVISGTLNGLKKLKPAFISVTYGAGGSTRDRTIEIASLTKNQFQIEALAHLTCIVHTAGEIDAILDRLQAEGIENILALRGDPPAGEQGFDYDSCAFKYAVDIIRYIRGKTSACIGAAAYPEGHDPSLRLSQDLAYLKGKVDAGVDFLITQLYFDNRVFYNFLENARRIGIACPVSAGILPVQSAGQIKRMVALCGASIPPGLWCMLEKYSDQPKDLEKAGIEYASKQVEDLIANGVDGIHLYTVNRVETVARILRNVGMVEESST